MSASRAWSPRSDGEDDALYSDDASVVDLDINPDDNVS